MFSTFMAHVRSRRQESNHPETYAYDDTVHAGYSTESASTLRGSRRATASMGNRSGSGSTGPSERSPKSGSRGHSRASTSTPTSNSSATITNPIRRETAGSSEHNGRRNPVEVLVSTEWHKQDEMTPRSSSRRRRLYPPVQEQEGAIWGPSNFPGNEGDIPDFTTIPFERPQSRADHRPGEALAFGPPPEVVRLDSTGTEENDNSVGIEIQNTSNDAGLQQTHSYPYSIPDQRVDSNTYVPHLHSSRDASSAQRQPKSPRPPRPPKSQKRQLYPYLQRSQGSRSSASLDDTRSIAKSASAISHDQLAPPPLDHDIHSHSEADFYASAAEDFEAETEGSISDYNSDNNGSPFASVLDSFPLPTRSVTSTTSSVSGPSSPGSAIGNHSMTKHRWGLRLQLQQLQTQGVGSPAGPSGTGYPPPYALSKMGGGTSSSSLNLTGQQPASSVSVVPSTSAMASGDVGAPDIYKQPAGYNYAFAHPMKPLSPIAEQDYMSPSPHSSKDENRSIRFRKGSGSVREKGYVLNASVERSGNKEDPHIDGDDKVSIRTSVRTGSLGSASAIVMSRAGSGSAADGTGHNKPGSGPDVHRPFITRQLNRTVSQTSSIDKSWTESVAGQPTPTSTATPTHSSAQPSPRIEGLVPSHVQGMGRTITTHLPAMRLGGGNRNGAVEAVHTPNSAGATPNSASGTTYSPTSTLQQSLSNGSSAIQSPPGAIVATTPAVPTSHGSPNSSGGEGRAGAIPKLPSIPAIDSLRFTMLESVTPRNSRKVDKMPIIPGSVEGHRGEEYEAEEEEYEHHSLHADSFVTAGEAEEGGAVELDSMNDAGEDLFIHRRWERDAALGSGAPISAEDYPTFRTKSEFAPTSSFTPAFWTFWMGFLFPVLWLVGGWHFTSIGEMPPKYTVWEWFFWKRRWRPLKWFKTIQESLLACCKPGPRRRLRRANSSVSNANARAGKIYPALPRWVAEKQSTDDGRMRLNDPTRSLRGIQFGYPFIPRCGSGHDRSHSIERVFTAPNKVLDQLYGVRLREVRGRPETGRRMLDPWIQRCRYAFCYALLLLAVGLCTASIYLIIVNTRNLR